MSVVELNLYFVSVIYDMIIGYYITIIDVDNNSGFQLLNFSCASVRIYRPIINTLV